MTPSLVRVFKTLLKASVSHWRYCQCLTLRKRRRTLHPLWQAWWRVRLRFLRRHWQYCSWTRDVQEHFGKDLFMPQLSHSHEWLLGMKSMTPSLVRVFKTLTKASVSHWRYCQCLTLRKRRRTLHPLWQAWMKSSSSFPKRKTLAILFLNSRCSRTFRQDLFMPQLSHSHEWLLGHEVNDSVFSKSF